LVDEDQPELVGQRIQVITKGVMVKTRSAMQENDRIPAASLNNMQAGISNIDEL
jgi:hypothetical protein